MHRIFQSVYSSEKKEGFALAHNTESMTGSYIINQFKQLVKKHCVNVFQ